jgi:biotin carboxylase
MKHIFVVGLDAEHLRELRSLPQPEPYEFHPLFSAAELKGQEEFPVDRLLDEGRRTLQAFSPGVDGVIGYLDFPISTTLPILRKSVGLPGPSLEAVLQCEHKYWSRMRQAEVVPEHVPGFCLVDPFAQGPLSQVTLPFPFWLKPVKAVLSHLGFRVENAGDFRRAIESIRAGIDRYAQPFNLILDEAELPQKVAGVDGRHCIAEALVAAEYQCTQEGYAFDGEVVVYGTVDSRRTGPVHSSFSRYQYPSALPEAVRAQMTEISRRVMTHIGYDGAPFNIEYFWDPEADRIWLLEINPRISKSHGPLFQLVDGRYHHQVMLDLGLGRRPRFPQGRGDCAVAAKFMVRRYQDAVVTRVPTAEEIARVEAAVPASRIRIEVDQGTRLSDLRNENSYSFQVATVFVGADTEAALESRFDECMRRLRLEFRPPGDAGGRS